MPDDDTRDDTDHVAVTDVSERHRYEIRVGGVTAGFAEYALRSDPHGDGDTIAFVHTEVDDAFAGQGLAGRLVRAALDDARTRHLAVLPFCPFVRGWIVKHPEYLDLVPTGRREQFDLT